MSITSGAAWAGDRYSGQSVRRYAGAAPGLAGPSGRIGLSAAPSASGHVSCAPFGSRAVPLACLVPFEILSIEHRPGAGKFVVLGANLLIVAYLAWTQLKKARA